MIIRNDGFLHVSIRQFQLASQDSRGPINVLHCLDKEDLDKVMWQSFIFELDFGCELDQLLVGMKRHVYVLHQKKR